jgi:Tfp pilus assembly protein PilF
VCERIRPSNLIQYWLFQYTAAKDAYERVLNDNPNHAKVLQQLGWLYHQTSASFANQDLAIQYLTKSLEAGECLEGFVIIYTDTDEQYLRPATDASDAQSWYLLGRAFMGGQKYNKAYEAYQQAVYRDGRNPTFWCSIGVLYYQINQYRDALDAYSRAIRLNPFISEVWYDLGSLYESCNNQVNDAIDAYARAHDLDPNNAAIKNRLNLLRNAQRDGMTLPPPPPPQDVHPTAYAQTVGRLSGFPGQQHGASGVAAGVPGGFEGPPPSAHPAQPASVEPAPPVVNGRDLAAPPSAAEAQAANAAGNPFRSGVPPPLANVDESRGSMSRHAPLAPMEVERNGAVLADAPPTHALNRPESAASVRSRYDGPDARNSRARESPRPGYPSPYVGGDGPRTTLDGPASRLSDDAYARSAREHDRQRSEKRDERDMRDPRAATGPYRRMSPPPTVDRRSPGPYGSRVAHSYEPHGEGRRTPAGDNVDRRVPGSIHRFDGPGRESPAFKSSTASNGGRHEDDRRREPLPPRGRASATPSMAERDRELRERELKTREEEDRHRTAAPPHPISPTVSSRNATPESRKKRRKGGKVPSVSDRDVAGAAAADKNRKPDEDVEMTSANGDALSNKKSPAMKTVEPVAAPPQLASRVIDEGEPKFHRSDTIFW